MIHGCISSRAFALGTPISTMAESSAEAGFGGIELVVNDCGELNLSTPGADMAALLRHISTAGVAVAALTSDLYGTHNFASPDESSRRTALETTRGLIELAFSLKAPVVWLRGAVIVPPKHHAADVSYETALNRAFEGMRELAEQAEKLGVKIAVRAGSDGFLLSPVETRDFVDRLNSPAIGVVLSLIHVARIGCPVDWLRCLSHRLCAVLLSTDEESDAGTSAIDVSKIREVLDENRYEGPLIYESAGNPSDIAAILEPFCA